VRAALAKLEVEAREFEGHLLHEPATFLSGSGKPYQVYSPFAKALRRTDPGAPLPAPARIPAPDAWPESESLADWRLDAAMNSGGPVVAAWQQPGEARARDRLHRFAEGRLSDYKTDRDFPGKDGSSRLSDALSLGEIGPRTCWALGLEALDRAPEGAEQFLRELAWRDFAHHLLWHSPGMDREHWRPAWKEVGWSRDERTPQVLAWRQGRTGFPIVDAAMREMWVTGRMHNRARMIVASLLTKHMMTDWRVGLRVFEDCLTDWDPANNAVNWQWVAGSGPDAAPFFRIYNPDSQAETWDKDGAYVRRWIAEGQANPTPEALSFFDAVPRSWDLGPRDLYPAPVLDLPRAREAALAAFRSRFKGQGAQPA
jgi:deoxyribodipyrimidine photo-lyase